MSPSAASRRGTDASRRGTNGVVVPIVVALAPGQPLTVESVGVQTSAAVFGQPAPIELGQPAPIVCKVLEDAGFFRSFLVMSNRDFPAKTRWFLKLNHNLSSLLYLLHEVHEKELSCPAATLLVYQLPAINS